ncbi:LysM domain-containing protein [Lactobacillus sp. ESL0680]|uniref:LysM peptidoglycan-binding domain-containing protein n=1 Tax=Lactobacillus sp. ESL0680 TaxID=2983210 RepID=UPI0023F6CCBB|nr:LysM domain-containing protein [Lactobacillus sp. ESL0680]WEV39398.1 LysM domain-containing protein [Lactobacillus sp. ESL0680]
MNQKQEKPYKHYARPDEPRTVTYKSHSKGWLATVAILAIVIVALVPVVHHLASSGQTTEQAVELQKTTKKPAKHAKKRKTKIKAKKAKHKNKLTTKKKSTSPAKSAAKTKTKKTLTNQKTDQADQYVVQDGDTLNSIAKKNNVSPQTLTQLNDLDADGHVNAGQTLKLK